MNITVTRDQWDRLLSDGEVWVAVEGEWKRPEGLREAPLPVKVAPPDLVAATKRCGTCGGAKSVRYDDGDMGNGTRAFHRERCPDCDGTGYPRVTVVTEEDRCLRCGRSMFIAGRPESVLVPVSSPQIAPPGFSLGWGRVPERGGQFRHGVCDDRWDDVGLITLGNARVAEVLPIYDYDDMADVGLPAEWIPHITTGPGPRSVQLWRHNERREEWDDWYLTLPGAEPGRWAVRLTDGRAS